MGDQQSRTGFSRRESIGLALAAASAIATPACAQSPEPVAGTVPPPSGPVPRFLTEIDFLNPAWNRDTYARIDGELDFSRQKASRIAGKVYGVRPNEIIRPLFEMDGFSVVRTMQLPDGNYRRLLKEIVFYRDIETGEIMDEWYNPYTDERVKVVPIANDPFNYDIKDTRPEGPSYGGVRETQQNLDPFLLNWKDIGDKLLLDTGIDLFYPAGLQPHEWPRESAGTWNQVSEHFLFFADKADIVNPAVTAIPVHGSWSRLTPWLPWMLMGQAPGLINYFCHFYTMRNGVADLPEDLVAATRAIDPGYLEAPTQDYGPSLSSLENYKLREQPAPVPEGWAPPQPPALPPLPSFMAPGA